MSTTAERLVEIGLRGRIAALEAEVARLRIACRDQAGVELSEENDRLIAEIERLRARIAVLEDRGEHGR